MQKAVNPNITKAAQDLLNYLSNISGKAIITGQHTQTIPMEEIGYIEKITNKKPLLQGFELLAYSPNINYNDSSEECLTEIAENKNTMETAIKWAKSTNGIVTLSFHWFSPMGGKDKSFYAKNTDFNAENILVDNSPEQKAFYNDMAIIAQELKKFEKENIPILWRPFHESYGDWFWWGAKGPVVASKLYKMMYNYYTNELNINNLLWVWNCDIKEAYPGDDFVDINSIDVYLTNFEKTDYSEQYKKLIDGTSNNKVVALAEVGYMPDINLLEQSNIPWAYYMTWSKEFCIGEKYNSIEHLKSMYQSSYAIYMN